MNSRDFWGHKEQSDAQKHTLSQHDYCRMMFVQRMHTTVMKRPATVAATLVAPDLAAPTGGDAAIRVAHETAREAHED